jgi:hypothetical protein
LNLASATDRIPDLEGVEVANSEEACVEAKQALVQLLRQRFIGPEDASGWRLDASDDAGAIAFSIELTDLAL